jgi:hypothetical protein
VQYLICCTFQRQILVTAALAVLHVLERLDHPGMPTRHGLGRNFCSRWMSEWIFRNGDCFPPQRA